MKAMVLTGLRKLEMREIPVPRIRRSTDVLIKMAAVGVCGSDVHYWRHGRIGRQVVKFPYIIGHECSGYVEQVGRGVSTVRKGDLVAIEPAVSCGKCDQCRAGREHTCRRLTFLGTPGQGEGCLCEYLVMPEQCCFPMRKRPDAGLAALCEPLSIGIYAVKLAGIERGARIGILGAGPIGLSVLVAARHAGAGRIYVTERLDYRMAVAKKAGASRTGDAARPKDIAGILKAEPAGLDVVLECCGQQDALDQGVALLKPGGTLVVVGIPEVSRVSFDVDTCRRREIRIQNVRRQVHCVQTALDLVEAGRPDVGFMITHRYPLEKTPEAFRLVSGYRDGVIKALIEFK